MLLELILALIFGILAGTITGLIPGIHVNLITIIILSASSTILNLTPKLTLVIFIVSMAITHTFVDYIPSIFLGAPDEDSFLSILPGHQFLLKGMAYHAIILTLYGSLIALLVIFFSIPFFILILPIIYPYIQKIMPLILIIISGFLIFEEKERKSWAMIIFIFSGFLGLMTINLNLNQPLLPLLTGLFGASNLIISINHKTKIPKQKIVSLKKIKLRKKSLIKSTFASLIAAPFTAFLPGLGASQAAIIGKEVTNIQDQREFLFLLGAINTIVMGLSFITLYSINKSRTGASVAVSQLIPSISASNLFLIILTITFSGIVASLITINLSKIIAKNIHKFSYSKISKTILIILFIIIFCFSDSTLIGKLIASLIFITSTALGIFAISIKIKRIHLMGCLLIPTILFYLL